VAAAGLAAIGLSLAPPGVPAAGRLTTKLRWRACGDGFQCATARVPRNYARPGGPTLTLRITRRRATSASRRIGSLLVNFGGPGDATAQTLRAGGIGFFRSLNDRFDIVGFDPRGTGGTDAIDCRTNPEQIGPTAQPFSRPDTLDPATVIARNQAYVARCVALNPRILPFVTTANTARDMDRIRRALGEDRISYLGFSYGTFLGATYETLFPSHVGRFVLDGAVDPGRYLTDPVQSVRAQTKAYEIALDRFLRACAAHRPACGAFGGVGPRTAFDRLVTSMNASPLPVRGRDPRPADGDDLLAGAIAALTAKQTWPFLAEALRLAVRGDGTGVRRLADAAYLRRPDGTYDPMFDRFIAISSLEARKPQSVEGLFAIGADDFRVAPHFWWNSGYGAITAALWPVRPRAAYYGPYSAPASAPRTLVVGTTYDPATPYGDALSLTRDLGHARLLTMRGDGHTAYGGNSRCVDRAVDAYLERGIVPAAGTTCRQNVPFRPVRGSGARAARTLAWPARVRGFPAAAALR
jgi:pimeloyl-ACP methyl ester carboxylesterase